MNGKLRSCTNSRKITKLPTTGERRCKVENCRRVLSKELLGEVWVPSRVCYYVSANYFFFFFSFSFGKAELLKAWGDDAWGIPVSWLMSVFVWMSRVGVDAWGSLVARQTWGGQQRGRGTRRGQLCCLTPLSPSWHTVCGSHFCKCQWWSFNNQVYCELSFFTDRYTDSPVQTGEAGMVTWSLWWRDRDVRLLCLMLVSVTKKRNYGLLCHAI